MSMIDHKVPPEESMSVEQLMQYETHFAVSQTFKDKARFLLHKKAAAKPWYEKSLVVFVLSVVGGLIVAYLVYRFGWN
jgi:hypothetical protein